MNRPRSRQLMLVGGLLGGVMALSGCGTVGSAASDLGLAGAGGVVGYQVSDHKIGGAAAGAALGYVGSRIAQAEIRRTVVAAEQRGYDRALNQAVKQQYWIMQRQQREPSDASDARLVPVVIPESQIDGVIQQAHVEYLRLER